MARVTIVGSGTLLPAARHHSAAHLVEHAGVRLLMDAGPGTVHGLAEQGIDWSGLTHIAVSHYHNDHVGDLSGVLFALHHGIRPPRGDALTLLGPPGFGAFVRRLADAFGDHVTDPVFPLRVMELEPFERVDLGDGVALSTCPTPHTEESVAMRVETPAGAVGYTGDTGPSDALADFLVGSRLLISECSLADPPSMDRHLSPSGVAKLASRVEPELLVVTHVYPPLRPEDVPALVSESGFGGRCVAAHDGTSIAMGEGLAVDP